MKATCELPDMTITVTQEPVEINTLHPQRDPDPDWVFVDSHGHKHRWTAKGKITLAKWVVTGTEWIGDEYDATEYKVGEYRCTKCQEVVEPGWKLTYGPHYIPGLREMTIETQGRTYYLRPEEQERMTGENYEAVAREIVASRDPDFVQLYWRDSV